MIQNYLDTETNDIVEAEQYIGLDGTVYYRNALVYVNNTDWLVVYPSAKVTAFIDSVFQSRFILSE